MKYSTEKELQKAAEKRIGYKLSDEDWENYAPDWNPPYDDSDLCEIVKQIPRAKPSKPDILKAAYVRANLIPQSVLELVTKTRIELFGSPEPPFQDLAAMRAWIKKEADSQPPAEGHAPRYGYRMEKGVSFEELQELFIEKPGEHGLEYATLSVPSESGWAGAFIVSDGTNLRRLWLAVRQVAKRLDCQEAQATAYILTGLKPLIIPITVEPQFTFYTSSDDGPNQGKIVLTIREPLSTKEVIRVYRKARTRLWGHERDHQIPTDKDCALVEFIRPRLNPKKPDWDGLLAEWKRQYPDWAFDSWRYLKITFERANAKVEPPLNFGPVTIKN